MTKNYNIRQIKTVFEIHEVIDFLRRAAIGVSRLYGDNYDWKDFDIQRYISFGRLTICEYDGVPVGFMLSRLSSSVFDKNTINLVQDLLYAKPGSRAAYWLMRDFIDFGRSNANHIITMIGRRTNIKRQSLEKLGFYKIDEMYSMETKYGRGSK